MIRSLWFACVAALLAGCAGTAGSGTPVPANAASSKLHAVVVVPARTRRHSGASRRARFVSPSSEGLTIVSYPHGSAHESGAAVVDISPNSALCTAAPSGGRTCTVDAPAPAGDDDIDFTDYDQAPAGGAIPSTAHVLSVASLIGFSVVANQANTATVYLEGQPYQFALTPGVMSFAGSGKAQTQALSVEVQDADGNDIVTSPNAPFDSPVTLAVSENNGAGHTKIAVNGSNAATTQTFSTSNDTFTILYDGGGSGGSGGSGSSPAAYWAEVTASAATALEPGTMQIAPLYLFGTASGGAAFASGYPASITFAAQGQTVAIALVQFVAPTNGSGYAASGGACGGSGSPGIAAVKQAGANSPNFIVTAGGGTGRCTITFTDGVSTYPVNVNAS